MGIILSSLDIGLKIKEHRKRAGLSQEGLAELVGLSFQQIQKYESGVNRLNTDKLQTIAKALCIPVAAFFDDQPIEALPFTDQERELLQSFRSIRDDNVKTCIVTLSNVAGSK